MKWPNFLERKERLFSPKTPREELIRWGELNRDADRLHDAVAFYRQAQFQEGLKEIRERAVHEGDVFLFRQALDGMDPPDADPEEWVRLAEQAESKGRWQDALKAREQMGDQRGIQRAKEAIQAMMGTSPSGASSDQIPQEDEPLGS